MIGLPRAEGLLTHWYLQVPSLLLAALIYLLALRLVSDLIRPGKNNHVLLRALACITDPIVRLTSFLTPRLIPAPLVVIFAITWLFVARIALFQVLMALAMRRRMG
jgi:hypothetical protein